MCGITGIAAFNLVGRMQMIHLTAATMALEHRGPDYQGIWNDDHLGLGHRRLSIIDTSDAANQPMRDASGRYIIAFNGEIFNFKELRLFLEARGVQFRSQSDTEVLLELFALEGPACLHRLNGFFAFAIADTHSQSLFIARDRYGIKPLVYLADEDKFLFASEMKSLLAYGIEREIEPSALMAYLHLNYTPAPLTMVKGVHKLPPGHYITVSNGTFSVHPWYQLPNNEEAGASFEEKKQLLRSLLEDAVQQRLVADVPLGSFLSGGVDSSIIAALAARHKPDLHTFSIGYADEKFFDETAYARKVARHLGTEHTVFSLTNKDLFSHVHGILDSLDEPFADSSAIAVYILSKHTRKHATVALSGDGADELFAGYNKHAALLRAMQPGWKENLAMQFGGLWRTLPHSRHSPFGNKARQLARFAEGMALSPQERYWKWAGFAGNEAVEALLQPTIVQEEAQVQFRKLKEEILENISSGKNFNEFLRADMQLVLPNDMLMKVDLMSMAHALEIRVPFLDHRVVSFAMKLPAEDKITPPSRKRILREAFSDMLPAEVFQRSKKGFEVPLLPWLRKDLKALIEEDLLEESFIRDQGIFQYPEIQKLWRQALSSNPGDSHARIWGLVVFQWWWKKYLA
jgi:asparagine synthase (glutamine-hydrolysing)